jgi:hypothetical protein
MGNAAAAMSRNYTVAYSFRGFNSPLRNQPTYVNVVRAGQGVRVPFQLLDYFGPSVYPSKGLSVLIGNTPTSAQITSPAATSNNVSQTTTFTGLRYVSASAQYEYGWQTNSSWVGTCRQLTFRFRDGTIHRVNFRLR